MKFFKENIFSLVTMALVLTLAVVGDVFAQVPDDLATVAARKTLNVFAAVKMITFIVGGFGLVVVAFMAIFGKVNWKWFAGLAVGLAILAAAGAIVDYATGDPSHYSGFGDTFDNAAGGGGAGGGGGRITGGGGVSIGF